MKKILYLIIYMTLALPFWGWGQKMEPKGDGGKGGLEYIDKYIEKGNVYGAPNPPGVDHSIYTARDSIRLKNGFWSSDVNSKPFIARIDESLVFPVDYQDPVNPNRPLDTGKPVGAIAGTVDVSPTGAATYQIPIFTPPGTAGMEPKISIVYNSQSGNGVLGVGWDIAGLSAITRTGQTIYHDGKVTPVSFNDSESRLLLDGNRLISTNGTTYGSANSTYATEIETFSKITALNTDFNRWFKVETKDGMTVEYGNTDDSRLFVGSFLPVILSWRINKITDANGNYMTYTYGKDNAGESLIKKIEYTGHTTQPNTYASVTFLYSEREDVQMVYIAGRKVKSTKLLRGIKVESEGQVVRRYWFNYAKMGFYSHLIEIIEEGSDGKSPNSTIIEYSPMNATGYEHNDYVVGTEDEYKTVFADINGDGRADFITITGQGNTWSWHVYLATDNGYNLQFSKDEDELTNNNRVPGITVFVSHPDINGKPHIFVEKHYKLPNGDCNLSGNSNFSCHKYIYNEYTFNDNISALNPIGDGFETTYTMHKDNSLEYCWPRFQTGNAYGDGGVYYIQTNGPNSGSNPYSLSIKNTNLQSFDWGNVSSFCFIDFDGDGADELLVQTSANIKIYKFNNGANPPTLLHTFTYNPGGDSNYVTKAAFTFGDFNGDGKMDIVMYSPKSTSDAYIFFSTGSQFTYIGKLEDSFDFTDHLHTGDLNGDGKDDIVFVGSDTIYVYYSYGDGTFKKETFSIGADINMDNSHSFVSHYKGTGKASVLIEYLNTSNQLTMHEFHFKGKELNNRAVSIIDGLNNKTQFEYLPLTKGTPFYTKETGSDGTGAVTNIQMPIYAVSKMTQPNGIGGTNAISFSYKGAKVHRKGKGFLGFSETTATNAATGIKTINTYGYDLNYFNVFLKETKMQLTTGGNIRTITHTNKTYHFGNKRIMPYVEKSVLTNHLTGAKVTEDALQYDFTNGNLKKKKTTYGDDAVFTETIDCLYGSYGNWGPENRMTEQKITTIHADNPNVSYIRKVNYLYNGKGNLITETTDNGIITNYSTFNAFGLPGTITITAPAPGALSYSKTLQYDTEGRFVTGISDPLGTTSQKYSSTGDLQYDIDITGQKTSYKYDGFGRLTGTKTPEGHIITTNYGWEQINGIKSISYVETTAPGRPTTKTYYDVLGREVRSETEGVFNNTQTKKIFVDKGYNAKGQLEKSSLPYFDGAAPQWTENEYYSDGRIKTVTAQLATPLATGYVYNNTVTTITAPDGKKVARTYNAHGDLIKVVDNNNDQYTVDYKYHSSGQPREIVTGGATMEMTYNQYGQQTTLQDPNAGTISYTYNAFGDMLTQTDARGKVTVNTYDNLRRIKTQTMTGEPPKTWDYNTSGNGKGQLKSIASSQSSQSYDYGDFGRLTKMTEKLNDGQTFETQYAYDDYGNKTEITYPGGFKIKRIYNNKGYVTEIRQASNNQMIWQRGEENAMRQPKNYKMGNNKTTTLGYDGNYLPNSSITPGIQDFSYFINPKNGNMEWRQDNMPNPPLQENFYYDGMNRLDSIRMGNATTLTMNYHNNGNIQQKSDAGVYDYLPFPAHAVDKIFSPTQTLTNSGNQEITYNAFHKAASIYNDSSERLDIAYGVDNQRIRSQFYHGHFFLQKTKYYAANYEKEVLAANNSTREINYISTPYGILAAYIKENSAVGQLYYLYKDHLGSITAITNAAGAVLERRSFDAWGRLRNPDNWSYNGILPMALLDRGYTGHEHLFGFDLINMNGRMYDPIIGRFLSPDPFVQGLGTQGFNCYSYALNNPLKFIDPTGYKWKWWQWALLGAGVDAITGGAFISVTVGSAITTAGVTFASAVATIGMAAGTAQSLDIAVAYTIGFWNPSESINRMDNHFKIIGGLFKTDGNRTGFWRGAGQLLSRWTWESPQTIAGLGYSHFRNLCGDVDRVDYLGGATFVTNENASKGWGVTLGNYININNTEEITGNFTDYVLGNPLYMHEFGHTFQSRNWGLLYLFVPGLSSLISANGSTLITKWDNPNNLYTHDIYWTETRANKRAAAYFKKYYDLDDWETLFPRYPWYNPF